MRKSNDPGVIGVCLSVCVDSAGITFCVVLRDESDP